jgi:hypothetical protein
MNHKISITLVAIATSTLTIGSGTVGHCYRYGKLTDSITGTGVSGATITSTGSGIFGSESGVTVGTFTRLFLTPSSPGTYDVQAHFAGEGIFAASNSVIQTYMIL